MFVPGPNGNPLFTAEPLTIEDLTLLAELFYLPYEHGNKAVQMLREFNWLRANSSVVSVNCKRKETEKVGEFIIWIQESRKTGKIVPHYLLPSWVLKTKWWMCTTLSIHWVVWL